VGEVGTREEESGGFFRGHPGGQGARELSGRGYSGICGPAEVPEPPVPGIGAAWIEGARSDELLPIGHCNRSNRLNRSNAVKISPIFTEEYPIFLNARRMIMYGGGGKKVVGGA
jgi:hypothetical protein